ncbi:MAG: PQQ-dependent sugar dehydrogenase [Granulosicoccus sp.]
MSTLLDTLPRAMPRSPLRRLVRLRPAATMLLLSVSLLTSACASDNQPSYGVISTAGNTLDVSALGEFDRPWAMTFLPTGELLVTEKAGRLWMVSTTNDQDKNNFSQATAQSLQRVEVAGVPEVQASGQGGLGDVIAHPDFSSNAQIYISYVERDGNLSGAAVIKARLETDNDSNARLVDSSVVWRQSPKVTGEGHYGHRLAFSPEGYLYITSGERQKFNPAQDMQMNLGKIIRLHDDGQIPNDNPWAAEGGIAREFWSIGHRNPLGIAFSGDGQLWVNEMGPRGGDELNRVIEGENYGYPLVSNGNHYSGQAIPDHDTRPDLDAPEISWTPVISPSSLLVYSGDVYPNWQGSGLIGGLSSQSLVRVSLDEPVQEIERFDMNQRIREVEKDVNGVVYLLEDGAGGRLLRLTAP